MRNAKSFILSMFLSTSFFSTATYASLQEKDSTPKAQGTSAQEIEKRGKKRSFADVTDEDNISEDSDSNLERERKKRRLDSNSPEKKDNSSILHYACAFIGNIFSFNKEIVPIQYKQSSGGKEIVPIQSGGIAHDLWIDIVSYLSAEDLYVAKNVSKYFQHLIRQELDKNPHKKMNILSWDFSKTAYRESRRTREIIKYKEFDREKYRDGRFIFYKITPDALRRGDYRKHPEGEKKFTDYANIETYPNFYLKVENMLPRYDTDNVGHIIDISKKFVFVANGSTFFPQTTAKAIDLKHELINDSSLYHKAALLKNVLKGAIEVKVLRLQGDQIAEPNKINAITLGFSLDYINMKNDPLITEYHPLNAQLAGFTLPELIKNAPESLTNLHFVPDLAGRDGDIEPLKIFAESVKKTNIKTIHVPPFHKKGLTSRWPQWKRFLFSEIENNIRSYEKEYNENLELLEKFLSDTNPAQNVSLIVDSSDENLVMTTPFFDPFSHLISYFASFMDE